MRNFKKIISLVLCVAIAASMCLTVLADEVENISTTQQDAVVENATADKATEETTELEQAETTEPEQAETTEPEQTETTEPEQAETTEPEQTETTEPEQAETTEPEQAETTEPEQTETTEPEQTETTAPVVNDGEIKVTINGVAVSFSETDGKPQIIDGRTVVPFRKVLEAMNAAVAWRSTDRTAHCFRNGISVMLTEGQPTMAVREYAFDGKLVYTTEADETKSVIDAKRPHITPVRTPEDRLLIPIRAAAEALGATVGWDGTTSTVIITIPEYQLKLSDKDAANLIEVWNYKPATELKTGSIEVKIAGNFEGAAPELGDGVVVTINESKQTAANGGVCVFTEVKAGTYTVTVENIPEGYAVDSAEVIQVTVEAGKPANVRINLVKAEATSDKDVK